MKEYHIFKILKEAKDTKRKLNELAEQNWIVKCSFALGNKWIIMERDK